MTNTAVRDASLVEFDKVAPEAAGEVTFRRGRGHNFLVTWADLAAKGSFTIDNVEDAFVLLPNTRARISGSDSVEASGHSVCIVPPGRFEIAMSEPGTCIVLSTRATQPVLARTANADAYATPNECLAPLNTPYRRKPAGISVFEVDKIKPPAARPRLKMLQSSTMSINWVEYSGARDRTKLSPHSHEDFEQGSLAIIGSFTHHLRTPWGPDATLWRDDVHMDVPPRSLTVIPAGMIHTTEGRGTDRHILIDVFAPVRKDFVAAGWIANSDEYQAP